MNKLSVSRENIKSFLISYHDLSSDKASADKEAVLKYVRKVGCLQFDPLNIAGNNHDLVLQSRVKNYNPGILRELLYTDRKLVDYWDKNMSIFPLEDWPYFSRHRKRMERIFKEKSREALKVIPDIREIIKDKGPVSSLDIEFNEKVNWWWAPTKIGRAALESMYFWGELVVHNKINTRKYYDFSHRHIDGEILEAPDPNTDDDSFYNWYVLRRISAVGILQNRASDAWLGINGMKSAERNRSFQNLIENKSILEINTEINTKPFFINSKSMDILEKSISGSKRKKRVSFLAPLDNLLWDRKLIKEIFDFEYVWEVYKPVSQRQYGYYVLPVLFGNDFVARFEPVRNRKNSTLEIRNWWWEKSFENMKKSEFDNFKREFNSALMDFMKYLEADKLIISDICRAEKIIDWVDL